MGIRDWFSRRAQRPSPDSEQDLVARIDAAIEATRVPFARVEVAEVDESLSPTMSKLGGTPYVPEGEHPPAGEPFAFIAQINFADLVLEPFPRSGLVQFWVAGDDLYGNLRDDPKSGFRCIYYPALDRPQRLDLPPRTVTGPLSEHRVARGRRLTFRNDTCVVAPSDYQWEPFLARNGIVAKVLPQAVYARYAAEGHRLGGYCDFTQSDPRQLADPQLSLLQLDSDEHIFWGDTGIGHWFIREADLRALEFSRVEYYWDCC
jgi:uncharacterized protein YwqG